MKRILLPVAASISILFTCMAFTSNPNSDNYFENCKASDVVLKLTAPQERISFVLEDFGVNEIVLCNLEKGKTYELYISQEGMDCDVSPLFKGKGDGFQNFSITPTTECPHLFIENFCSKKVNAILSVVEGGSSVGKDIAKPMNGPEFVPITTNSSLSVTQLIEDVFIGGGCFDVTNVQLIGSSQGVGSFANGAASVGFDEGVVLSSGNITAVSGPNSGGGTGSNNGGGSDTDLALLTAQQINDVAGIEFDFSPTLSTIDFNFVFGSEEYCEWVNSAFNDVFGFFISGPGINGPYSNNGINIALVPNTATPITINSVNNALNTQYFVPNDAGCGGVTNAADIEFDGYTTVLTATANVIPCSTYHIRLVVGDGTDSALDSGVFLEAGSFNAGGQASVSAISLGTGTNQVYEGCGNAEITFTRETGDPNVPLVITYSISPLSTATSGVDYLPIPLTVTIPPGQNQVTIPLTVLTDNLAEGMETIIIDMDNSCSCTNSSAEIVINDVIPMTITPMQDQVLCGPQTVSLAANVAGGVPPFSYTWSNGATTPSINPFVSQTETFNVFVTDACGNTISDDVLIDVSQPSTALVSGLGEICPPGLPFTTIQFDFTGAGPWELIYMINGVPQAPITGITDNPYVLPVSQVGTYEILQLSANGCPGLGNGQAVVTQTIVVPVMVPTDVSCWGNNDGMISVFPQGGAQPYTYQWSNPAAGVSPTPNNLPAGTYTVTVTDANGCFGINTATVAEPAPIIAQGVGTSADCNNPNGGSINLTVTGGSNPLSYLWSNGSMQENPTGLPPGSYTVTVTDLFGCTAQTSVDITGNIDPPIAVANAPGLITCANQQISINGNGSSAGANFIYTWSTINGSILSGQNSINPIVGSGGTYEILVTNTTNGCTETALVTVNEDTTPPVAVATPFGLLDCNNTQTILDGNGSSAGANFSYNWTTTNGVILSGATTLNPVVNSIGTYVLTVIDNTNGCIETTSVDVFENNTPPIAVALAPQQLDCNSNSVTIVGAGSSTGANYTYLWTTGNGVILSGENTLTPQVGAAGTYQIEVTDVTNGCTAIATVDVTANNDLPISNAGAANDLTCNTLEVTLDGSGSSSGTGYTYQWSTQNGNIVNNGTTLTPTVNSTGTYELLVTAPNGCTAVSSVMVGENIDPPTASAGGQMSIGCVASNVNLDGSGSSSGGNFTYTWSTQNGNIVSGGNTLNPTVNATGNYILTVQDNTTGCTATSSTDVIGSTTLPNANAGTNQTLTCTTTQTTLDGSNSASGSNISYQWSTQNGNIISGANTVNPSVNGVGVYTLTVTDNDNGCTSISTVEVLEDSDLPLAVANAAFPLTCTQTTTSLDGNGSSAGGNFTYLWTTQNGNILSGENTLTPSVNSTGTYQLLVTNTTNGCTQIATVDVDENGGLPTANAGTADDLTCDVLEISLNGSGSTGTNFTYAWSTQNGNIVSGGNTLTPMINATGTYELLVTDNDNGCTAISTVTVDENIDEPTAVANPVAALGCIQTSVTLDGNGSSAGSNFTYLWTTQNGSILSGENTLTPEVNAAGTYEILVTNTTNGCTQVATIEVSVNGDVPMINAGTADDLTCDIDEVTLSGTASTGASFTYQWSTQNGNIVSGGSTLSPTVNATGVYELLVTNTDNGCTAISTVEVMEDVDDPMAVANPVASLGCTQTSVILDGNGSSAGGNFTYLWTTQNGNILSGENTLTPEVNAAGIYEILVTNTTNGCTQTATIDVAVSNDLPTADAGVADDLTCGTTEIMLAGNASVGSNFTYLWTTQNGNIISGEMTLSPTVNAIGTYELLVTDIDNGCTALSTVTVGEDTTIPEIQADPAQVLGCSVTEVALNVMNMSPTGTFSYTWNTSNGNISSGGATLTPTVDAVGEYTLTALNWGNGCSASVTVEVQADNTVPTVDAGIADDLTCAINEVTLNGSGSTGANFTYLWTTQNGNILSGENTLTPTVNATGTYELLVTDTDNGCTAASNVSVGENLDEPIVNAGLPQTLSCSQTSLQLNGNGSSAGANFTYLWTTQNGNILSGENTLTPEINAPGDYELQVTNTDNGCTSSASINIGQDSDVPVAAAGMDDLLNCDITSLNLDGSSSSTGLEFSYNWTTQNGNIVFGENTLTPEINAAGTYQLIVTNTLNGCTSLSSVDIVLDDTIPTAEAGISQFLSCTTSSVTLDGTGSSTADVTYQWTTQNGNILSGGNTLSPEVNATGIYELIVTSTLNGCTQSDEVEITQDSSLPTADAGDGFEITCNVFEGDLDGTASTVGNDINFEWSTQNGNIVSGENTLTPTVNAAGTYQLTLTNTINGCTAISSVTIIENNNEPTAEAGNPMELNCNNEILSINGSTVDTSSTLVYEWTTQNGNIVSGENTLFPEIDQAGTYQLMITNTATGCVSTDGVIITDNFDVPTADAGATDELNCTQSFLILDGNASSVGANIVYQWTTQNGNIVSGENTLTPEINSAGDYQLLVTDLANGCTAIESVSITESVDLPTANAGIADDLTCVVTTLELNGNGSSAGTNFEYFWTTTDGNILSGENTLNPIIDATGTYALQVTNTANNCTAISTVEVLENLDTPIANAGLEGLLNCTITQTQLDASNSSIGNDIAYQWITTSGSIVSGENTLTPTVAGTGTYELIVTNTITGCTANSFVDVVSNEILPDAIAVADDLLTCSETSVVINGGASSSGNNFSYQWTTQNGVILSGETSNTPIVGSTGAYTLVVTNTQSGCSNETTVTVEEDLAPPVAAIDQTGNTSLDCITSSIVLDGSGSQPIGNLSYQWTTTNGNILSGANTSNPEVDDDGDYILTVTNLINGCTATETITIDQDLSVPIVDISNPLVLTCDLAEIDLDATNSSVGNYSYQWTTSNGNIITGANTLTPTINQSGTYQLTVIDLSSNCDNVESITVVENTTPPIAEAGTAEMLDCQTTSVSLNGAGSSVGNVTYEWTTSNGNIIANTNTLSTTVDLAGTYILQVTDLQNGCTATDIVEVEEDEEVPTDIVYSLVLPECYGEVGSVTVEAVEGGTPPYLYSIDGVDFYSGHTFTVDAGDYNLFAQDASGCETQINFEIPTLEPVTVSLPDEVTVELGEDYQIQTFTNIPPNEIQSIYWNPSRNLSCTDCLNPIVEQLFDNGVYEVTITNIYGCQAKARIKIIIDKSRAIYIPNVFTPNEDGNNDLFMIFAGDLNQIKQVNTFQIYDRWGEVVFKAEDFMPMDERYAWDGKFGVKTLNPQVFVYWAEIEFIDGETIFYKGDVALRK